MLPPHSKASAGSAQPRSVEAEEVREPEVITEAYASLNAAQWEWPKVLPDLQRKAVSALLANEALVHPDHPLRQPHEEGIHLFNVTDSVGCVRLSLSLLQLEYLQYYIHEMRLADPVWAAHLALAEDKTLDMRRDKEDVGTAGYPPGEEWVPLPDVFAHGENIVSVEDVFFTEVVELKRILNRQHSKNKKIRKHGKTVFMTARVENEAEKVQQKEADAQDEDFIEAERRRAQEDNAKEGHGLRRGPEKQRAPRESWRSSTNEEREEGDESTGPNGETLGWGGFPVTREDKAESSEGWLEEAQNGANLQAVDAGGLDTPLKQTEPEARTISTDEPIEATEAGRDADTQPKGEPSPTTVTGGNFTTAYYEHAQQALLIATLGGMSGAHKEQPEYLRQMASIAGDPPIGRSLFISLRVVTWEADDTTVLEVGWSAIWWQDKLEAKGDEDKVKEMRDVGHIRVQDHLADKKNGTWKPNFRSDFRFGDSLPVASKDVQRTVEEKIKILSKRAGGGPTYVIMHSVDDAHADPINIGLDTKDWYRQFKPASWDYPSYHSVDGIGKVFIIDTAILFAAIEWDPKAGAAPIRTQMNLEEIAWILFGTDDLRRPEYMGNAGNDAFYNLEIFVAMLTSPSLETLRADFQTSLKALNDHERDESAGSPVDQPASDDTVGTETLVGPDAFEDEDDYSEDEMIKGVFCYGPDGEVIQIE